MGYARRERRIVCSAVYQEVDILPLRAELESRGRLEGPTRVSSEKLERANQRQRERHFAQLVAANFVRPGVLLVDMTYAPGMEPESFEAADANMVRYLRRIKYLCRQRALPAPLYVAVTEGGNEGGEEENKRLHHHRRGPAGRRGQRPHAAKHPRGSQRGGGGTVQHPAG